MKYIFLRFPNGKAKAVTLSYDDGSRHDIRFSNTISRYGLKCTFNLTELWALTKEEVEEYMLSRGHEIAVHGALHRAPGRMRPIEGIRDVLNCRLNLEEIFGIIIRGMAYPDTGITQFSNGVTYDGIKNYLTELDIAYSRTLGGDNDTFALPTDWYAWMPTARHNNPKVSEYIDKFLELDLSPRVYPARRAPRLFYLWGHSFEFDNDDNWDLLDKICKKLSENDDIWYATNIQIYDYVSAYNSLIWSANNKIVYNPSLLDIWFDIDGVLYKVSSGETLKIV